MNNKTHSSTNPGQIGCPNVFRGIQSSPVWDTSDPRLFWVKDLENAYQDILDEFLNASQFDHLFQVS